MVIHLSVGVHLTQMICMNNFLEFTISYYHKERQVHCHLFNIQFENIV